MAEESFNPKYYRMREKSSDLSFAVEGISLPEIDESNIAEVMERVKYYFERCDAEFQEPGVAGMCLWLGITTERWKQWCEGAEYATTHQQACERIMTLLESRIEGQMINGKINPVTAMFLLKSQFGYVDTPRPKKAGKKNILREMPMAEVLKLAQKNKSGN